MDSTAEIILNALHRMMPVSMAHPWWANKNETSLVRPTAAAVQDKIKLISPKCLQIYENKDQVAVFKQLLNILVKLAQSYNTPEWTKYI